MCTLIFDYDTGDINVENPIWYFNKANISQEDKDRFEAEQNTKYAKFCKQINDAKGSIIAQYSIDGKRIVDGYLDNINYQLREEILASIK